MRARRYAKGASPVEIEARKEESRLRAEAAEVARLIRIEGLGITWSDAVCGDSTETPHVLNVALSPSAMPECVNCEASLHGCESCGPADGFIR